MSYKSIIKELSTLTSAPIQVCLPWEEDAQCSYFSDFHLITMCLEEVEQVAELFGLPNEEVFKYILLHEIGHSLDPEFNELAALFQDEELNEAKFISEVNAWKIADSLIEECSFDYKLLRAWALSNYDPDSKWRGKHCLDYFTK